MAKSAPKRKSGVDPYKRGYANGVIAAVDALLDDLDGLGALADVEYDEDGIALSCKGCLLAARGYQRTSDRWSFAIGTGRHHT